MIAKQMLNFAGLGQLNMDKILNMSAIILNEF